jgi:hypothetical protein
VGRSCVAGVCECSAGLTACGTECVDTLSDNLNCGDCGVVCAGGQRCENGACTCDGGLTACSGQCVDLQTSPTHCGACGNACGTGQSCTAGVCSCAAGQTLCGTLCTDLTTDAQNCGACGTVCDSGLCTDGVCQASAGTGGAAGATGTGGASTGGAAGAAGAGGTTVTCEDPLVACGTECVDLQTDPNNCGECYNVCLAETCDAGVCPTVKDCYKPTVVTSPLFADFEDYDGTADLAEWGFAFNAPAGEEGAVYAGPYFYDDETGTPTQSMTTGHDSEYAVATANPNSTEFGGGMGFWMSCIDLSAYEGISLWVRGTTPTGTAHFTLAMEETSAPLEEDPAGGGTCEATADDDCAAAGVEIPVTSTWTELLIPWVSFTGGVAAGGTPVTVDGHNITGMNFNISLTYVPSDPDDPEGEYVPAAGGYDLQLDDIQFLEAGACPAGQTLCGVGCVNYQTDHDNCGSCGNACDVTRTCVSGRCQCPDGYTDCDGQCANLQIDAQHCGACNAPCTGPCVNGSCQASECTSGMPEQGRACEEDARITLGKYFIINNLWGANNASGQQCIWSTCQSGNTIGWGTEWSWSGGSGVISYDAAILGWHWGWEVAAETTGLPVQVSSNANVTCGWTFRLPALDSSDVLNVAYDLFTHSTAMPGYSDNPNEEIMIWLYRGNGAGPIGGRVDTVSVAGTDWDLYQGNNNAWNVLSFVRTSNTTSAAFNLMDFMNALVSGGYIPSNRYLSSIQAGTEIFSGSARLDTDSFYCTIR